jgi:serine protease Do
MRSSLRNARALLAALAVLVTTPLLSFASGTATAPTPPTPPTAPSAAESASPSKGWLGVYSQERTDDLRDGLDYKGDGVLIDGVVDGSPAEKAGIKKGDVLVRFNGQAIDSPDELQNAVRAAKGGAKIEVELVRAGKTMKVSPTLDSRPTRMSMTWSDDAPRARVISPGRTYLSIPAPDLSSLAELGGTGRARLGVRLQDLNSDLAAYFSVPDGKGVLIVEVEKDSPASRAGLKSGDVILKVGDHDTFDSDDVVRAIRDQDGKVAISILRRGQKQTVTAEIERPQHVVRIVRDRDVTELEHMHVMTDMRDGDHHHDSHLQDEMEQLRDEIKALREQLQESQRKE